MFDYGEACPISMASSVLCERWTLQIIRELLLGATRYSEIQKFIPNISPSLLRNRLRYLEEQGIVIRATSSGTRRPEYRLCVDQPEDLEVVRRVHEILDGRQRTQTAVLR